MSWGQRGFTLKEVLIVMAVIVVLTGIATPVVVTAKARGRAASCLSNTGQLAKATLIYASENNDRYPMDDWTSAIGLARRGPRGEPFPILKCPDYQASTIPLNNGVESGGYARNACLQYKAVVDAPSEVVLVGEVAQYNWIHRNEEWQASTDWLMQPDAEQAEQIAQDEAKQLIGPLGAWGSQRHSGRGNYAFVDGHAKSVPASAFFVPTGHPCGLYSRDPSGVAGRLRFAILPFGDRLRKRQPRNK